MLTPWPDGFARVLDEDWTRQPVESLALKYDTVENHGWYDNLDPTVTEVADHLRDGQVLLDYSAGTGIFADRLLRHVGARDVRILMVDASPKFLRLALSKLGHDERVAFRWIRWLAADKRLERVDEVLPPPFNREGVEAIVSTNAVHLYSHLDATLAAWERVLVPGGRVFVQSGNIRNAAAPAGTWIIDETVEAIHEGAMALVRGDARWAAHRAALDDEQRLRAHAALRGKYFLPVRPLSYYVEALEGAGLSVSGTRVQVIEARVSEWYEFLAVYHEGVLGWVGGVEKVEGRAPSEADVADRLELMRLAMDRVFDGREAFDCCWTYVTAHRPPATS